MPSTPFIGLSVLVHLCIIVAYRVVKWKPKRTPVSAPTVERLIVSYAIIVSMFTMTITGASFLVVASIHERHATFEYVQPSYLWLIEPPYTTVPLANLVATSLSFGLVPNE